jgi:hypothetical protein
MVTEIPSLSLHIQARPIKQIITQKETSGSAKLRLFPLLLLITQEASKQAFLSAKNTTDTPLPQPSQNSRKKANK